MSLINNTITIKEAQEIINKNLPAQSISLCPISKCNNKVLAKDIITNEPLPRYTSSAMDGFAVLYDDLQSLKSGKQIEIKIIGESRAGIPFKGKVKNGES